ncbi:MAG TPA: hypothetical protein VHC49_08225 [Mycobacteriales bacterium]|nr:hypothetical protein [Mycobacteriales bacterium]
MGLPLIATLALAGCGAGQITETMEQQTNIDGVNASVGGIDLRNVSLAYPDNGIYQKGSEARVEAVIVNTSSSPDRLLSMQGASATGSFMKTVTVKELDPTCKCSPAAPRPSVSTPKDQPIDITLAPQANVNAYGDSGPQLILTGLTREFRSSQQTTVTFKFQKAGTISLKVPVGTPPENPES